MATFDWLTNPTNSNADPFGYAGPQNGLDASMNAGGAGSKVMDLLSDETFIRTLGEMGASIGGKGSIGAALGTGASSLVRNRAVQREGEKVANNNQNQTLYDKMIGQLSDGSLMSDPSKNDAFDSILIGGDKSITAKYNHTPESAGPLTEQQGLDSITNTPATQTNDGGYDLPDFTSSQGSKADFSGLDPADVGMILNAKNSASKLTQRAVTTYLAQKNRMQNRQDSLKASAEAARVNGEEKLAASIEKKRLAVAKIDAKTLETENKKIAAKTLADSKTALEQEKARLKNATTQEEKNTSALRYRKLKKEVENLEAGKGATGGLTEDQRIDNERKTAERQQKITMAITGDDTSFDQKRILAQQANANPKSTTYYHINEGVTTRWLDGKSDVPPGVQAYQLPVAKYQGKVQQITSPMLEQIAQDIGGTVEDALTLLGVQVRE